MDPQKTPQPPVQPDEEPPVKPDSQATENTTPITPDMSGLEAEKPATPEAPATAPGATVAPETLTQHPSTDTPVEPLANDPNATITPETAATPVVPEASQPPAAPVVPDAPVTDVDATQPVAENPAIVPAVAPAAGKPKRKKLMIALVIIVTLLILGAGAAAAYVGYVVPNKPKYVLARALGNTVTASKLHSASFDGSFEVRDPEGGQTFSGIFDGKTGDKAFDGKVTLDAGVTKIGVNMLTVDGKDMYLKVSGLDGVPELLNQMGGEATQYAPLVQSFNNQWFVINESLIKASGVAELTEDDYGLSDADAKKVETAYRNHLFMEVTKTYEDQDVHGTPSFHYQAKVNEAELEAFLKEVKAQNIKNLKITDEQIADVKKAKLGAYPVEVWIAKDTRIINKVAFDVEESGSAIHFEVGIFDFNKQLSVEKPADAKSLLELLAASEAGKDIQALLNQKTDGRLEAQAQVN